MKNYSDLDESARDLLREMGIIGTGNAVTSLAQMMGCQVDIRSPGVSIVKYQKLFDAIGHTEEVQTGILVEISGDISGIFLFLLDETFTEYVLNAILDSDIKGLGGLSEMEESLICELGNIVCGSYIRALSQLLEIEIDVSVPSLCIDMGGAILSAPLSRIAQASDDILLIENTFYIDGESFIGRILFFPELEALETVVLKSRE